MTSGRKTLFELAPDKFIVPGQSKNGAAPPADLVFERDKSDPGVLYRAWVEPADLGLQESDRVEMKKE
ncbi:MAG: hypothetical protein AAB403_16735 [Planctomycetota bacterium]